MVQTTLDWTEGKGVDLTFDPVGGTTLNGTFAATRFYGNVATLLEPSSENNWKTAQLRNLQFS